MKVIDEILLEWSYRCPDGIVDLNNPDKKAILDQILAEYNVNLNEEEDSKETKQNQETLDDKILNAIINLDDLTKEKVLKQIQQINKSTNKELKELLSDKGLGSLTRNVIYNAQETGQEDDLIDYLKSSNQITFQDLLQGNNLFTLFEQTPLNEDFLQSLVDITGTIGNINVGRGEVALTTLLKGAKKVDRGDITVGDKNIEVKNRSKASGGILVPEELKRGSSKNINTLLLKAIENLFTSDELKKELINVISKSKTEGGWPTKINYIYKKYLDQQQDNKTKSKFEDEINEIFKSLYDQYTVDVKDYLNGQEFQINNFKIDLSQKLAKAYYEEYKFDYILFINPSLDYAIYSKDTFIKEIGTTIKIGGFSDPLPRLSI